ncbi:hypothetical protein DFP73DRAFT_584941 [Morchella snyderi]|nr:hypothetical protein DFP73DRAFT_584941 [Morchella snyderi]
MRIAYCSIMSDLIILSQSRAVSHDEHLMLSTSYKSITEGSSDANEHCEAISYHRSAIGHAQVIIPARDLFFYIFDFFTTTARQQTTYAPSTRLRRITPYQEMKTRSSSKAVENNGHGAGCDDCPRDDAKSVGKTTKVHKKKPSSDAAGKEAEIQNEVKGKLPALKNSSKDKEAGTEKGGKIAHFADNVEKNEQRIAVSNRYKVRF